MRPQPTMPQRTLPPYVALLFLGPVLILGVLGAILLADLPTWPDWPVGYALGWIWLFEGLIYVVAVVFLAPERLSGAAMAALVGSGFVLRAVLAMLAAYVWRVPDLPVADGFLTYYAGRLAAAALQAGIVAVYLAVIRAAFVRAAVDLARAPRPQAGTRDQTERQRILLAALRETEEAPAVPERPRQARTAAPQPASADPAAGARLTLASDGAAAAQLGRGPAVAGRRAVATTPAGAKGTDQPELSVVEALEIGGPRDWPPEPSSAGGSLALGSDTAELEAVAEAEAPPDGGEREPATEGPEPVPAEPAADEPAPSSPHIVPKALDGLCVLGAAGRGGRALVWATPREIGAEAMAAALEGLLDGAARLGEVARIGPVGQLLAESDDGALGLECSSGLGLLLAQPPGGGMAALVRRLRAAAEELGFAGGPGLHPGQPLSEGPACQPDVGLTVRAAETLCDRAADWGAEVCAFACEYRAVLLVATPGLRMADLAAGSATLAARLERTGTLLGWEGYGRALVSGRGGALGLAEATVGEAAVTLALCTRNVTQAAVVKLRLGQLLTDLQATTATTAQVLAGEMNGTATD